MSAKRMKKTRGRSDDSDLEIPPLTEEQLRHIRNGIPNTRAVRRRLRMTQQKFADAFGFSLTSVRDWEQGRHAPDSNTISYLRTIALKPEEVLELRIEAELADV